MALTIGRCPPTNLPASTLRIRVLVPFPLTASPASPFSLASKPACCERLFGSGRELANLASPLMDRFREAFTSLSTHTLQASHQSILLCSASPFSGLRSFSPHAQCTD